MAALKEYTYELIYIDNHSTDNTISILHKSAESDKKVKEDNIFFLIRTFYYRLLQRLSDIRLVENATGFGLYEREVIEKLRSLNDPYPYFRGLVADLGYEIATVPFIQSPRKHGITKNNFYTLFDMAMLGLTKHSKVPLRMATMLGFITAILSALIGLFCL